MESFFVRGSNWATLLEISCYSFLISLSFSQYFHGMSDFKSSTWTIPIQSLQSTEHDLASRDLKHPITAISAKNMFFATQRFAHNRAFNTLSEPEFMLLRHPKVPPNRPTTSLLSYIKRLHETQGQGVEQSASSQAVPYEYLEFAQDLQNHQRGMDIFLTAKDNNRMMNTDLKRTSFLRPLIYC